MLMYVFVNISIIILALLSSMANKKTSLSYKKSDGKIFILISFTILFIVSAFRGDFATDYKAYINFFNFVKQSTILEMVSSRGWQEIGYVFFNVFIASISQSEIAIMIVTTLITLLLFYTRFVKDSVYIWLSILMFVSVGSYYTSFNMMRQMLAIAIVFAGMGFLYKNKLLKFIIVVIIASSIHISAIVMIPLGLVLKVFKPSVKNIMFFISGTIISSIFVKYIVAFIMKFVYFSYALEGAYGMEPINFKIVIVPISISVFALIYSSRSINLNDNKHRIWFNAVLFYLLFAILSLQIKNFNRLADYFLPFLYLLVPLEISKLKKSDKLFYLLLIPLLLTIYVYFAFKGGGFDPYYFYWSR